MMNLQVKVYIITANEISLSKVCGPYEKDHYSVLKNF